MKNGQGSMMAGSNPLPKVLIVDDVVGNVKILASILWGGYDTLFATSGSEALELLSCQDVDLILLDIEMPDLNGYTVLERIKSDARLKEIPTIFLTARNSTEDEVRGLELGAADYITKPFSSSVVLARVQTQLSLKRMNRQLAELTRELLAERQFIESMVQTMVGPVLEGPVEPGNSHLRYWIRPLEKTSGDLLMVADSLKHGHYYFLGDISGHGLSSAMLGPIISYIFYSMTDRGGSLAEIIHELNHYLKAKVPPNIFLAGCFIGVDPQYRRMEVWNCAMPDGVVFRGKRQLRRFVSRFHPLGIIDTLDGDPEIIDLSPGDQIIFYSDGMVEVSNHQGRELGIDALIGIIATMVIQHEPMQYVYDRIIDFNGSEGQKDDMTIAEILV
ncbi:MAG: fused response regulator/phosphatase [Magnetococcales bacterium]|nr:fused response regulator/phosphatase [Magnetococcales bacterium]MBF0151245.1 fused response regulator/phosphatase [Magnetococcales bacterium]MBF0632795.1 fused response regulator/phosphatase [Magnetococcales bacterium]